MSMTIVLPMAAITAALILYTIGVFAERHKGTLEAWHLAMFWLGLACDTAGTFLMTNLANDGSANMGLHVLTGAAAVILMFFHASWATLVVVRNQEKRRESFHRFSVVVWLFWLIPYVLGMFLGMPAVASSTPAACGLTLLVVGCIALAIFLYDRKRRDSGRFQ